MTPAIHPPPRTKAYLSYPDRHKHGGSEQGLPLLQLEAENPAVPRLFQAANALNKSHRLPHTLQMCPVTQWATAAGPDLLCLVLWATPNPWLQTSSGCIETSHHSAWYLGLPLPKRPQSASQSKVRCLDGHSTHPFSSPRLTQSSSQQTVWGPAFSSPTPRRP